MRLGLSLSLLLAAAGCAPAAAPAPTPVAAAPFEEALASAALQVRRCYRSPRVASEARLIVTRLRVRFLPDGALAGLPVVVGQDGITAANRDWAPRMAQAAIEAVLRCAPLAMPPALRRDGGISFDLTFSPSAPA